MNNAISIEISNPCWIREGDDPFDLCSHGDIVMKVDGSIVLQADDVTTSAAGLQLLRTLSENHASDPSGRELQLFPHCGHAMWPSKDSEDVEIIGCDRGCDPSITHEGESIAIELAGGTGYVIPFGEYKKAVLAFADDVERFYVESQPRQLSEDTMERKGYETFWAEWKRRKNAALS